MILIKENGNSLLNSEKMSHTIVNENATLLFAHEFDSSLSHVFISSSNTRTLELLREAFDLGLALGPGFLNKG